jgi:hypothetical protein
MINTKIQERLFRLLQLLHISAPSNTIIMFVQTLPPSIQFRPGSMRVLVFNCEGFLSSPKCALMQTEKIVLQYDKTSCTIAFRVGSQAWNTA